MPQFCRDWILRVKKAELEHAAMRFAADRLHHLVHERDEPTTSVPLATVRQTTCTFLSYLPPNW